MDKQLLDQCQEVVKYANSTGINAWGEPTSSTTKTVSVRIIGRTVFVLGKDAQQILSEKQMVSESRIPLESHVWLPGESTGNVPWTALSSAKRVDEDGNSDYWKTWLGRQTTRGSE